MRNSCPICNSTNVYRLHTARRIGSTVGAVGGAATGAGGALSGAQTGAAVGAVGGPACRRAFKFDHLCALNFDQV